MERENSAGAQEKNVTPGLSGLSPRLQSLCLRGSPIAPAVALNPALLIFEHEQ